MGMAVIVLGGLLAACGSSTDASSASAPPTASPTPTPASVVWAGRVCSDMDRVKASVGSLGQNLSYDVTSDRSALDQIQRQLTGQALAVGDAADRLLTTLGGVPVDFAAAAEMAATLTKSGQDTRTAASTVSARLQAAASAGDVLTAAAEVGQAIIAAKAAYEAGQAFVAAIGTATSTASGELGEAFALAPQCRST